MNTHTTNLHLFSLCLVVLISSIVFSASGQETLAEFGVTLKGKAEAFSTVMPESKSILLVLIDNRTVTARIFDRNFNLVDSLNADRPSRNDLPRTLGYCQSGDVVTIFFSSGYLSPFVAVHFDFAGRKVTTETIELPVKNERFVGAVSEGENFYLFSVKKSDLKLYSFGVDATYETKSYDLPRSKSGTFSQNVSTIFRKDPPELIDADFPTKLKMAASTTKMYCYPDSLVLAIDSDPSETTLIAIDRETLSASINSYPQGKTECHDFLTSNSYLYDGSLYQVIYCIKRMIFKVTNLKTSQMVKELNVTQEDEIDFGNTEELPRSRPFLRMCAVDGGLISVYRIPQAMAVTFGAYTLIGGGPKSFGGYGPPSVRTIYFTSLLDPTTFEHMKDMIVPETILDRIEGYKGKIRKEINHIGEGISAEVVFRQGTDYILCYYNRATDHYTLTRFTQQ